MRSFAKTEKTLSKITVIRRTVTVLHTSTNHFKISIKSYKMVCNFDKQYIENF